MLELHTVFLLNVTYVEYFLFKFKAIRNGREQVMFMKTNAKLLYAECKPNLGVDSVTRRNGLDSICY